MQESKATRSGCAKFLLYGCGGLVGVAVLMTTCVGITGSCATRSIENVTRANIDAPTNQRSNRKALRGYVSKETWNESTPWPLAADEGRLFCIDRGGPLQAVYIEVDEVTYGLNTWANVWADEYGAKRLGPLWLVDEEETERMREANDAWIRAHPDRADLPGDEHVTPLYVSIGPLITKGLRLCDIADTALPG